jgi:hypothetical protein
MLWDWLIGLVIAPHAERQREQELLDTVSVDSSANEEEQPHSSGDEMEILSSSDGRMQEQPEKEELVSSSGEDQKGVSNSAEQKQLERGGELAEAGPNTTTLRARSWLMTTTTKRA